MLGHNSPNGGLFSGRSLTMQTTRQLDRFWNARQYDRLARELLTAQDPFVSAFILFHLADQPAFRVAVRLDDAVAWLAQNEPNFDPESRRLWQRATLRCRLNRPVRHTVGRSLFADVNN